MTKYNEAFDGFAIELYLDEDNEWLAHFVELPNISASENIPEKALALQAARSGVSLNSLVSRKLSLSSFKL